MAKSQCDTMFRLLSPANYSMTKLLKTAAINNKYYQHKYTHIAFSRLTKSILYTMQHIENTNVALLTRQLRNLQVSKLEMSNDSTHNLIKYTIAYFLIITISVLSMVHSQIFFNNVHVHVHVRVIVCCTSTTTYPVVCAEDIFYMRNPNEFVKKFHAKANEPHKSTCMRACCLPHLHQYTYLLHLLNCIDFVISQLMVNAGNHEIMKLLNVIELNHSKD
uniref:Uncharacterized protein n=1 Tax=Glossina brevipalpis TaxID=37001 RepID=A0A1A9WUH1_9MUSC